MPRTPLHLAFLCCALFSGPAGGRVETDLDRSRSAPLLGACTPALQATEVVRNGSPPNTEALLPGVTSGPVIGSTWDPIIDHMGFVPQSVLDLLAVTASPAGQFIPSYGTLLCAPPKLVPSFTTTPGTSFAVPIPDNCAFVGVTLCTQGVSIDPGGAVFLTNALDITFGTF